MSKFLMLGHAGVLNGCVENSYVPSNNDLVLEKYHWGGVRVLKNGVGIIESINSLIKYYDYEVVFHSENKEADQIKLWEQLCSACEQKGLEAPKIRAMAVYDPMLYNSPSANPTKTVNQYNIAMACWGADNLNGKKSVRLALENLLKINLSERFNHIVFDYGESNITVSKEEGYQAFLMGIGEGRVTLDEALNQVLSNQPYITKEVIIYSDFDGTMTKRAGGQLVFSAFYKSFLVDPQGNYKESLMKKPDELQALFRDKFGEYNQFFDWHQKDTDILISIEAINFLHQVLKNPRVCINIVTRNRQEYIQALLKYQGFSKDEIGKINILDSESKDLLVQSDLNKHQYKAKHIFILDDDQDDYNWMCREVSNNTIHGYHKAIGQFQWNDYLEEIKTLMDKIESKMGKIERKYLPFFEQKEKSGEEKFNDELVMNDAII